MTDAENVRARISRDYGNAVTKVSSRSCCGDLAKVSAKDIGYSEEELKSVEGTGKKIATRLLKIFKEKYKKKD